MHPFVSSPCRRGGSATSASGEGVQRPLSRWITYLFFLLGERSFSQSSARPHFTQDMQYKSRHSLRGGYVLREVSMARMLIGQ